jgi:hypothetical protein
MMKKARTISKRLRSNSDILANNLTKSKITRTQTCQIIFLETKLDCRWEKDLGQQEAYLVNRLTQCLILGKVLNHLYL